VGVLEAVHNVGADGPLLMCFLATHKKSNVI
jgi:hypothetical protein